MLIKSRNIKVLLSLIIISLILLIFTIFISQTKYGLRYKVYCEDIQMGDSMPVIRKELQRYGEFEESPTIFNSFSAIGISFQHPLTNLFFGLNGVTLVFKNEKLQDVRVPDFSLENYKSLCK